MQQLLQHRLIGWGCWLEQVDSTNLLAKWLLKHLDREALLPANPLQVGDFPAFPWLIVADEQTAGRGRGGNRWWSPRGGLMLTIVVEAVQLHGDRSRWAELALVCGVACAEAVEACNENLDIQLKWPNDLFLGGKKLGGILIESEAAKHWMLGIGINANIGQQIPHNLDQFANAHASLEHLAYNVCRRVLQRVEDWSTESWSWFPDWKRRCLLAGRNVVLEIAQRQIAGMCSGVDRDGRLIITEADGTRSVHVSGSVKSMGV